jgi:SRSO17 transposase
LEPPTNPARFTTTHVQAKHQALHHVVAQADRDDAAVLAAVRAQALPAIARQGPVLYGIVDDPSFPTPGTHAVGVARHYRGPLSKPDNCQVAVSLSVANDQASRPIADRLFVPEAWANDPRRRAKAGVPAAIGFESKPRSRSGSSTRRWRMACRWGSSWGIRLMVNTVHFGGSEDAICHC